MAEKYPKKRAYFVGKLAKFLKDEGLYEEAVEEVKKQGLQKRGIRDISEAFIWERTSKGRSFWADIWLRRLT